jgi:hypothetical protein
MGFNAVKLSNVQVNQDLNLLNEYKITNWDQLAEIVPGSIPFVIDGGGSAITTGQKGHQVVPFDLTLYAVYALADLPGDIVVDIWVSSSFPPTSGDSICGSYKPTIISPAQYAYDPLLTGWTKALTAGQFIAYNVDSIATITRCGIYLLATKDVTE